MKTRAILIGALSVSFALCVFLAQFVFEESRAVAADFREHERQARSLIAEFKGKDLLHEQQLGALEKKIDSANAKLDVLIERLLR